MSTETTHSPFHCGTQALDWFASNCDRCVKGAESATCEIRAALDEAAFDDGTVSTAIAERMGYLDHSPPRATVFSLVWPCKEWEPTDAWKQVVDRRKTDVARRAVAKS